MRNLDFCFGCGLHVFAEFTFAVLSNVVTASMQSIINAVLLMAFPDLSE